MLNLGSLLNPDLRNKKNPLDLRSKGFFEINYDIKYLLLIHSQ